MVNLNPFANMEIVFQPIPQSGNRSFPFNKSRELWYDCLAPGWEANILTQEHLVLTVSVLELAEKLCAGKEPWSSGLRAVALGQLRLLSRIYQFTKGNQLITVTASPGTQAAT